MVEKKLILVVTEDPVIYDLTLKDSPDQYLKQRGWRDVATSIRMSCECLLSQFYS